MARAKSILDGFFRPSEPLDVLRAARALGDLSHGEVKTGSLLASSTGAPERDGLLCERIFGPVKNHECRCGLLNGPRGRPPSSVGERCPKCGVEAISPRSRDERFAHLDIPIPVLHPALVGLVAGALGWSEADVRDVVFLRAWIDEAGRVHPNGTEDRYEHLDRRGATILRERLADISSGPVAEALREDGFRPEDLLLARVPVVPPGDRPLITMPGGHAMPGPDNLAYASLVERRNRMLRLLELSAPEIILVHEAAAVNERFAALLSQMTGTPAGASWQMEPDDDEAQEESQIPASPVSIPAADLDSSFIPNTNTKAADPARPVSGAILEDGSVLLQYSYAILHVAKTGRILRVIPAVGHQILATTADSRYVLTQRIGLHLYDLREGRWSTDVPDELPCVYMDEAQEQALLVNARKGGGRMLHEVGDYPDLYVSSPDGRFLWVEDKERSGGVFSAETELCVLLPDELRISEGVPSVLRRDGTRLAFNNDDYEDRWPERPTWCALALAPSDRFVIVDVGVVAVDDRPVLALEPPIPAVALSRDGGKLLVFRRAEALVVESFSGDLLARFDVSALEADLALTALGKLSKKAREALLCAFGGTWGLAAAQTSEIAAAGAVNGIGGIGKAQAAAIARALKRHPPVMRIAAKTKRSRS